MKKIRFSTFMMLLVSMIISVSCSETDPPEPEPEPTSGLVGTWVEDTGDQYGFTFVFRQDMTCDMIYRDKGASGGVHTSYDIENGSYVVRDKDVEIIDEDGDKLFLTIISMTDGVTMRCQWWADHWPSGQIEGPYTFVKQSTPTPPDPPKGQRLVKLITMTDEEGVLKSSFYYKDGRISRVENNYKGLDPNDIDGESVTYTFEGYKIRIAYDDGEVSIATLNDQGYVSSVAEERQTANFTYSDKRMTGYADNKYIWSASYTWNAGNIVSSQMKFGGNQSSTIYTYSDIANNPACNIDLNFVNPESEEFSIEDGIAVLGYCGLRSEKLIGSISIKEGNREQRVGLTYTLDKKGFVTKIVSKHSYDNSPRTFEAVEEIEYY